MIKRFIRDNWSIVLICTLLVLVFFGVNAFINYNTDTYIVQENVASAAKDMVFRNSRPVIGIMYYIVWFRLGLSTTQFATISFIMAIIFLTLALILCVKIFEKFSKNRWVLILISFLTVCNPLVVEYFMFIEKGCFALAIFFAVLAAYLLLRFFETKKIKFCWWCLACVLIVTFTYQGILALFIALSMPICLYASKNKPAQLFKYLGIAMMFFVIGGILTIIYGKLINSSRTALSLNIVSMIMTFFTSYGRLLFRFGSLLPPGLGLLLLIILLVINIILLLKYNKVHLLNEFCYLGIVVLLIPVCALSPLILGTTDWLTARIVYGFGCIFGLLTINIFRLQPKSQLLKYSVMTGCIILLLFQYFSFINIFIAKYQNDTGDKYTAIMIQEIISRHELKNNIKIEKIAFYYDQYPNYNRYNAFWRNQDFVVSSFNTDWSQVQSINYYNGTSYLGVSGDEQYQEYCKNQNWDTFSADQLVFDNDTLHLCVY